MIVIGEAGSGKSCLLHQFINHTCPFPPSLPPSLHPLSNTLWSSLCHRSLSQREQPAYHRRRVSKSDDPHRREEGKTPSTYSFVTPFCFKVDLTRVGMKLWDTGPFPSLSLSFAHGFIRLIRVIILKNSWPRAFSASPSPPHFLPFQISLG